MNRTRLTLSAILLTLSILSGCTSPTPKAVPVTAPPILDAPVVMTLDPISGIPGTPVTVKVRLGKPEQLPFRQDGTSWSGQLCWGDCGLRDYSVFVNFTPVPGDELTYTGTTRVPVFLHGSLLSPGPQPISMTCAVPVAMKCSGKTDAMSTFRVTESLPSAAWTSLSATEVKSAPALTISTLTVKDPINPNRQVICQTGNTNQYNDPTTRPRLLVTAESGKTWRSIWLTNVHLGGHADLAGCRAVALDPHRDGVFYLAGGGDNRDSKEWSQNPEPLYTVDNGKTWNTITPPAGFAEAKDFLGFAISAAGVTAWFGAEDPQTPEAVYRVAGLLTTDGGSTWRQTVLLCPSVGDCAWDMPTSLLRKGYRGLMRSEDGGHTWTWATWAGRRITAMGRFDRLSDGAIEVTGACVDKELAEGYAPLLRSLDQGRTWQWVEVPATPGGWSKEPAINLQPDGSLILRVGESIPGNQLPWYQLRRGQSVWEPITAPASNAQP